MKRLFLLSFLLVFAVCGYAQDVLVTEDGENITAWDVDISGAQKIYYKTAAGEDAPMKSIAKEKVLLWKKADGTKVRIGTEQPEPKAEAKPVEKEQSSGAAKILNAADPEANSRCIQMFNNSRTIISSGKMKTSPARHVYAVLNVAPESAIADKNLELQFRSYKGKNTSGTDYSNMEQGLVVTAKNKTDQTIYIYLANTYFLRHGVATPFNVSRAEQSLKGGELSATGFSQNVIAIPANSSLDLGTQLFFTENMGKNLFGPEYDVVNSTLYSGGLFYSKTYTSAYFSRLCTKQDAIGVYQERTFSPNEVPIDFGFKLTYSFNEKDNQLYQLDTQLYVAKMVGTDRYGFTGKFIFQDDPIYFWMVQNANQKGRGMSSLLTK
ncbi:MAG: hypothetical protein J5671_00840 [Bacteroidaceae bacterium]|nr:hypothetical protein [Bacteroidaceae bacterium]